MSFFCYVSRYMWRFMKLYSWFSICNQVFFQRKVFVLLILKYKTVYESQLWTGQSVALQNKQCTALMQNTVWVSFIKDAINQEKGDSVEGRSLQFLSYLLWHANDKQKVFFMVRKPCVPQTNNK